MTTRASTGVLHLVVVSAGLGRPSSTRLLADRLADASVRHLAGAGVTGDVRVVELRDHAHDITTQLLRGFAGPELEEIIAVLTAADGAIAVSPVFNGSYSGLFKSFFDLLDMRALNGLPVVIGATGGTDRHSLVLDHALRPLFNYLHAVPVPTGVYAATADWGSSGAGGAPDLAGRIDRAATELVREMLRPDRDAIGRAPDPLALPVGFDPSGLGSAARRAASGVGAGFDAGVVADTGVVTDAGADAREWLPA